MLVNMIPVMGDKELKKKRRVIYLSFTFCFVVICAISALSQFRFRGSEKVVSSQDIAGAKTVFYEQKDVRWAEDFLGDSAFTMKSSGCLVTCIAAAVHMSNIELAGGEEASPEWMNDPGELNRFLSQYGIYDSSGNLQWNELEKLESFQVDVYNDVSADLIEECLKEGRYPVVRVRLKEYGSFHYVLIVASQNGMFYCMDPLISGEELVPLSQYGNRVYALRCISPNNRKRI